MPDGPKRPQKKRPQRPLPVPGRDPMPRSVDLRFRALAAWCRGREDARAKGIQQQLEFSRYAREAWDPKCRSQTMRELWAEACGEVPPPPALPVPGRDPVPQRIEARLEALRAWCEANPGPVAEDVRSRLDFEEQDAETQGQLTREAWSLVH